MEFKSPRKRLITVFNIALLRRPQAGSACGLFSSYSAVAVAALFRSAC
jgi:hypothetical protein